MAKKPVSGTDKVALRANARRSVARANARSTARGAERRVTCRGCNGAGRVGSEYYDRNDNITRQMCDECNGSGQVTA